MTRGSERLTIYALLNETARPDSWHIRLDGPSGRIDQILVSESDYPRAAGSSDVDGDGTFEWWVKMGDYASHGAPWARLNLFFPRDNALSALTLDGEPLAINYGGISRMGEGADCRDGGLVLMRAEAQDERNSRWKVSDRVYELEGTEAIFIDRTERTIMVDNYVDPAIRRYFRIECNGDVLIPF